jgi:hypothetical protein
VGFCGGLNILKKFKEGGNVEKKYDSIKGLIQDSVDGIRQYQDLMAESVIILYFIAEKNREVEQQKIIAGKTDIEYDETQIPLKKTANALMGKIKNYRETTPAFLVSMFEEGLSFLENLYQKHL